MMKTNLKKILSISGQPGLYNYLSNANAGVIVESLLTKKKTICGSSFRLTALSDISIYTSDDELPLHVVFTKMHEKLGDQSAPSGKSSPEELRTFFEEVIPNYDKARFYTSHMKKVVDWYNILKDNASLDFELPDEEKQN
ncbi:MAG: DUF5606 domain-containing protein [Rikenellaceae bacterium]|jgi:hypothetical protein|nr:DUF5606 domain-containing protein [Bacteroidales bacterium]